jgi:hypothetical protein
VKQNLGSQMPAARFKAIASYSFNIWSRCTDGL